MIDIALALTHLRPSEEWVLDGEDYEGLTWLSDTEKPTIEEIELASELALEEKATAETAKASAKASAITKLAKLGLTEEEATALLG